MLKINSEEELIKFLKIISENAVTKTKKIFEKDPYIKSFQIENEKNNKIYEQEEGEPEEEGKDESEEGEQEEEGGEEAEEGEEPENKEKDLEPKEEDEGESDSKLSPAAKKALDIPDYLSGETVEVEQILAAINLVRAGNSTKEQKTKEEITKYFDRLDKEEKAVLLIFLKEFAKIMTGATEGSQAQDPSDPKAFFDIISTKKKKIEKEPNAEAEDLEPQIAQNNKVQMQGEEDITPPIRVNESQDLEYIRKKIKMLMGNN